MWPAASSIMYSLVRRVIKVVQRSFCLLITEIISARDAEMRGLRFRSFTRSLMAQRTETGVTEVR